MEGQITWFVYMVGAIIKGRLTTGSTDAQEVMDGDLSARVIKLLYVVDSPVLMQARYQLCCGSPTGLHVSGKARNAEQKLGAAGSIHVDWLPRLALAQVNIKSVASEEM